MYWDVSRKVLFFSPMPTAMIWLTDYHFFHHAYFAFSLSRKLHIGGHPLSTVSKLHSNILLLHSFAIQFNSSFINSKKTKSASFCTLQKILNYIIAISCISNTVHLTFLDTTGQHTQNTFQVSSERSEHNKQKRTRYLQII